jgi:predicted RNase H-like HicB family nuclease
LTIVNIYDKQVHCHVSSILQIINECPGVYSNAPTLEQCRKELEEVLEEWVLFRVYKNLTIPPIEGIEIKIKKQAVG